MSDGPHKTLPMRAHWKALLRSAFNPAFSGEEISQNIAPALSSDWLAEVTPAIVRTLGRILAGEDQGTLFQDQTIADAQALRAFSNSPMDASLLDGALDALADGLNGQEAMIRAAEGALEARLLSAFRQVEEHVLRECFRDRAIKVRERLETAASGFSLRELASNLLTGTSRAATQTPKQDGIDDGVAL